MAGHKLPLNALLTAVDRRDTGWLHRQAEAVRKDFAPLVMMRWVATVSDGPEAVYMLWAINERVNGHLFDFAKHPDLMFRLMASCGIGKKLNHQWLAGPVHKVHSNAASRLLHEHYPEASDAEIALLLTLYDRPAFLRFIDECGVQEKDAKDVVKAYDQAKNSDSKR